MMLKVNDEFLDFNDVVTLEKQSRLFESIDEISGDYSYQFELDKTSKNLRILSFPLSDVKNKSIYRNLFCDVLDDSGVTIYKGLLRVERINEKIECSFFSGNYNWISQIAGPLSDLDLSEFDTELNEANVAATWSQTEGLIFPLFDSGTLITRSYRSWMIEDMVGSIYVKTVFKKIFQAIGIKLDGDLISDPIFDNLIIARQNFDKSIIENRSTYAGMTANQSVSAINTLVQFNDDYTNPFFDGSSDNYSNTSYRYTADVKMRIKVDLFMSIEEFTVLRFPVQVETRINGIVRNEEYMAGAGIFDTRGFSYIYLLEAGDYIEINIRNAGGGTYTVFDTSNVKFTPLFIYFITGSSLVPQWTKEQFISNILSIFCCVCDFEPVSKTLTIDFFEGIKRKQPIDLSNELTVYETDFEEFISTFAQSNFLRYVESDEEEIKKYNISEFIKYGAGVINVENDFIERSKDLLESDFSSPISYINSSFEASLERFRFFELSENGDQGFTMVTDFSGTAVFHVPDSSIYFVGELVTVSGSTEESYNGEWVIDSKASGVITLMGVSFATDATGTITRMQHEFISDDSVYLFVNTKYRTDNVPYFSGMDEVYMNNTPYSNVAYSFFNLLNVGKPINDEYKQGLSFGPVSDTLFYQRTILEKYWPTVENVLNDPVKQRCTGYIPRLIYSQITPLRPIIIKSIDTSNMYYLNRVTGYIDSSRECEVELIKLS